MVLVQLANLPTVVILRVLHVRQGIYRPLQAPLAQHVPRAGTLPPDSVPALAVRRACTLQPVPVVAPIVLAGNLIRSRQPLGVPIVRREPTLRQAPTLVLTASRGSTRMQDRRIVSTAIPVSMQRLVLVVASIALRVSLQVQVPARVVIARRALYHQPLEAHAQLVILDTRPRVTVPLHVHRVRRDI